MKSIINTKFKLTNGVKSVDPWNEDDSPSAWIPNPTGDKALPSLLVPPYYAAKQARVNAVADLPFTIYKLKNSEDEVDNSDDYKNIVKFLPNPREFFGKTEASLIDYGRAYWYKMSNRSGYIKDMQYFDPRSIEPKYKVTNGNDNGDLDYFERRADKLTVRLTPERVLYLWLPDPSVEIGPPKSYPFTSAFLSASALEKINTFVQDYMSRGAVKAMMLAAKGMPGPDEAERIETWFNRFMRGVNNLRWKVFNSDAITPTIVGEGLEAFKGISVIDDLTQQIHTAMGTRHLLEDENYATAEIRQRDFILNTIVPEARFIGDCLNEQMLNEMGYRIEFDPSRLEIFQPDESTHMAAFGTLSQAMTNSSPEVLEMSLSLAGIVLSEDQLRMLNELKAKKEEEAAKVEEQMQEKDNKEEEDEKPVKRWVTVGEGEDARHIQVDEDGNFFVESENRKPPEFITVFGEKQPFPKESLSMLEDDRYRNMFSKIDLDKPVIVTSRDKRTARGDPMQQISTQFGSGWGFLASIYEKQKAGYLDNFTFYNLHNKSYTKTYEHLDKWMRKACKHIGKDVPFLTDCIPESEQDRIHLALPDCKTEDDIKALFESCKSTDTFEETPEVKQFEQIASDEYKAVIDKLRLGIKERQTNSADKVLEGLKLALEARKDKATNITIHNHPGEQPEIKFEPSINVETPTVNVTNEIKENKPSETDEVIKAIRKLNK